MPCRSLQSLLTDLSAWARVKMQHAFPALKSGPQCHPNRLPHKRKLYRIQMIILTQRFWQGPSAPVTPPYTAALHSTRLWAPSAQDPGLPSAQNRRPLKYAPMAGLHRPRATVHCALTAPVHSTGIAVLLLILHPDTRLKVLTGSHAGGKHLTAPLTDAQREPRHLGLCLTWVAAGCFGCGCKDECSGPTRCQSQLPREARPLLQPWNQGRAALGSPELRTRSAREPRRYF